MNIKEKYKNYCIKNGIEWQNVNSILSYDNTTLFCPAGMQQFKSKFKDLNYRNTIGNIQPCLRLNDFDKFGDGIHLGYFNMLGLFSFRQWDMLKSCNFWLDFLEIKLELNISKITLHPDKVDSWSKWFDSYNIVKEEECKWSDGEIGGYCVEFYVNHNNQEIEVGNVVNPLGDCIDFGGGLERLDFIVNGTKPPTEEETLVQTCEKIIESGIKVSNTKHGYILRKILRQLSKINSNWSNPYYKEELKRQEKILEKYYKLKDKYKNKNKEWWFDTHGIDLDLI